MLALADFLSLDPADGSTGHNGESGVRKTAETLTGIGPARATDPVDAGSDGLLTLGASAIVDAEATTPVPEIVVSERPGATPLTVQLRLLDAYLRQVKDAEVPLTLAVPRTSR